METKDVVGLIAGLSSEQLDKRIAKVVATAIDFGWDPHPITMVCRFSKEQCHPFYMRWDLNPETMRWRFAGSRVALVRPDYSGKLTLRDVALYMEHPEVIEKEEPTSPWRTQ